MLIFTFCFLFVNDKRIQDFSRAKKQISFKGGSSMKKGIIFDEPPPTSPTRTQ